MSQPFSREFAKAAVDAWQACGRLQELSGLSLYRARVEVRREGTTIVVYEDGGREISVAITDALIAQAYPSESP